jgi:hypothetical protein
MKILMTMRVEVKALVMEVVRIMLGWGRGNNIWGYLLHVAFGGAGCGSDRKAAW